MTHAGAFRSKNVGTSNRNVGEIPTRRKTKVSLAMLFSQGSVGPKPMAKAAGDGQQVNIPAPPYDFNGVTERSMWSGLLDFTFLT